MATIGPDESPRFSDWTDPGTRESYELQAREYYDLYKQMRAETMRAHVEYGKWLIATMVAIHGGALIALNSLRNSNGLEPHDIAALVCGAIWNVAGIVLIMLAGFMAWLNFQLATHTYDSFADPKMLQSLDHWPKPVEKMSWINVTLYVAAGCGLLSGGCFIASAFVILRQLSPQTF